MKIGELAKRAGCKAVTVRFYERRGLMPEPSRADSNYRVYGEKDLERLCFIRHCRSHGMTLEEIESLIKLVSSGGGDHQKVHEMIKNHIKNIAGQIAELESLKASLEAMLTGCGGDGSRCGILKTLSGGSCAFCGLGKA